jgi:hypothetical protein
MVATTVYYMKFFPFLSLNTNNTEHPVSNGYRINDHSFRHSRVKQEPFVSKSLTAPELTKFPTQ